MCYETTRWIEVKWRRPICSCRYVVLAQTAQPAAASRTDTQYASMHAEVELQSELDWTAALGGDMNQFSLLLLDLHPVDLLRHVPEKLGSAIGLHFLLSRSPCSHLRRRRLLILFFSASCYRFMPETTSRSMPGAGTGLWCMSRTQASSGPTKAYTWHIKQLRFKSDFFWNHVNAVILFIIVVVESLRGTFFSHWCLDAKQDAVKTKLHSKSR